MDIRAVAANARLFLRDRLADGRGPYYPVRESDVHAKAATEWLDEAMRVHGGEGIAAGYSYKQGWLPGFPETTGYIIPTLCDLERTADALRMGAWLLTVQAESGGIPAGPGGALAPVVFDTGQVLFGLLRLAEVATEDEQQAAFAEAAKRAGAFLVGSLDEHGRYARNLFNDTLHTYNVRSTWALVKAGRQLGEDGFVDAARRNLAWTLAQQTEQGTFAHNTFWPDEPALTHTMAYTLRGLAECGLLLEDEACIEAARRGLEPLLADAEARGTLAGTYSLTGVGDWSFACLTGNCQVAIVLARLAERCGEAERYRAGFRTLLDSVKRAHLSEPGHPRPELLGVRGSWPHWGGYSPWAYPNWAAKFFIDALLIDLGKDGGAHG